MATNIKSTDARKKSVVAAIKQKSGANKVTQVNALPDGTFSGHAMKGNRDGYLSLGIVTVTAAEVALQENTGFATTTATVSNGTAEVSTR